MRSGAARVWTGRAKQLAGPSCMCRDAARCWTGGAKLAAPSHKHPNIALLAGTRRDRAIVAGCEAVLTGARRGELHLSNLVGQFELTRGGDPSLLQVASSPRDPCSAACYGVPARRASRVTGRRRCDRPCVPSVLLAWSSLTGRVAQPVVSGGDNGGRVVLGPRGLLACSSAQSPGCRRSRVWIRSCTKSSCAKRHAAPFPALPSAPRQDECGWATGLTARGRPRGGHREWQRACAHAAAAPTAASRGV